MTTSILDHDLLFRQKIEMFEKELGVARFRLVAKEDQLHETERKLYTATTSAEKFRNESLRIKLKVDEMKSKYETGSYQCISPATLNISIDYLAHIIRFLTWNVNGFFLLKCFSKGDDSCDHIFLISIVWSYE